MHRRGGKDAHWSRKELCMLRKEGGREPQKARGSGWGITYMYSGIKEAARHILHGAWLMDLISDNIWGKRIWNMKYELWWKKNINQQQHRIKNLNTKGRLSTGLLQAWAGNCNGEKLNKRIPWLGWLVGALRYGGLSYLFLWCCQNLLTLRLRSAWLWILNERKQMARSWCSCPIYFSPIFLDVFGDFYLYR